MSVQQQFIEEYTHIIVTSFSPQVAKEKLLCYSIIGRNPQKEHIMSVDITANFISPVLKFSKEELHFSTVLVITRCLVECDIIVTIAATWQQAASTKATFQHS